MLGPGISTSTSDIAANPSTLSTDTTTSRTLADFSGA